VGRMLKRLHLRGLLVKVPRTRRWRVTDKGRRISGHVLMTYRHYAQAV
jgi:Mn-dependent DtxR family transcriptional regulator